MYKVYYTSAHSGVPYKSETWNTLGSWGLYAIMGKGKRETGAWDFKGNKQFTGGWGRVEHTWQAHSSRQPRHNGTQGVIRLASPSVGAFLCPMVRWPCSGAGPFLEQVSVSESLRQGKGRVKTSFWVFCFLIISLKSMSEKPVRGW